LLIDATLKEVAPPLALPKREFMERARQMWDELGLPALTPQSPWHGYSLGDWDAAWDLYASRAVAGKWEGDRQKKPSRAAAAASRRRPRCATSRIKPTPARSAGTRR